MVTANDGAPELVACIRRGPFAVADEAESIDYLLSRKRAVRAPTEKHSVLHVLSYQRRIVFFGLYSPYAFGQVTIHRRVHFLKQNGFQAELHQE